LPEVEADDRAQLLFESAVVAGWRFGGWVLDELHSRPRSRGYSFDANGGAQRCMHALFARSR
jgi:hypothetical protein